MRNLVTYRPQLANIDRWFDTVFEDWVRPAVGTRGPRVDVREAADGYHLEAELPGLTEKDIDVNVAHNLLTIASKSDESQKDKSEGYVIRERRARSFSRSFVLPKDVDADNISANFSNGLLSLDIPRSAAAKPKQIEVTTSA